MPQSWEKSEEEIAAEYKEVLPKKNDVSYRETEVLTESDEEQE